MSPAPTQPLGSRPVSWDRRDAAGLAFPVALFVASRLAWLWFRPETASYWEEAYRWVAMHELLNEPVLPLLDYQADHYQGGSLLMILLGLPLVWLGGDSLLAFKLTALGFSTATLAALYLLARRFFGRRVAVLAGLAYVAGPPLVAFWGLVVMGFHAESVLPSLAQIFVLLGLLRGDWRGSRGFAALGLVCGLGISFSPTAGVSALACGLAWLLLEGRPRARETLGASLGLALGLLPWLVYNLRHGFAGIERVLEVFGLEPLADFGPSAGLFEKTADLFAQVLPFGLLDPSGEAVSGPARVLLALGFAVPAALALLAGLRRAAAALAAARAGRVERAGAPGRDRLELVFHIYLLLFLVLYLGSRFAVDPARQMIAYRLFAPFAVVAILPAAISFARAAGGSARVRRGAFAAGVACLGSMAVSTLVFARRPARGAELSFDLGYTVFGALLQRKHAPEIAPALEIAERIRNSELRQRALAGIGWGIADRFELRGSLEQIESQLRAVPGEQRAHVLLGLQFAVAHRIAALEEQQAARGDAFDAGRLLERLRPLEAFARASRRPSLVLVTLDTTRVDHLSAYGYGRETTPNLDGLARRGVRFDRVWSTSSWTLPAHASLFTGLYPATHGARFDAQGAAVLGSVVNMPVARYVRAGRLDEGWTTLAELLSQQGYQTGAFVAGPWLHRSFGLLQGFDTIDDEIAGFAGRKAEEVTDRALAWIQGLDAARPYFLFVNYFDPHAPYEPPPGYVLPGARVPFEPPFEELLAGRRQLSPAERAILVDRYDGEIRYMDHHLGRLLDAVYARPLGRDALVIVTADHGEALGEGGRIGHTFWLSEELLRVPLLVRFPGERRAGARDATPLQLVDVLPLVAAELGLELPESVQGLAPGAREAAFAEVYREPTTWLRFGERYDRDLGAVIRWPHKLVRSSRGDSSLYLLGPSGTVERSRRDPQTQERLAARLDAHERSLGRSAVTPAQADPATLEALRQLGYVE